MQVSSVISAPQNPQIKPQKTTKTSIFYINDVHGQMGNMESLATAAQSFDTFVKQNPKIDALKLSGGDILIGEDPSINKASAAFLNFIGLNATTLGNHEFDIHASKLGEILKNAKFKITGMNMQFHKPLPLRERMVNSYIHESNGSKYGIIGLQPIELVDRMRSPDCVDGITVDSAKKTLMELQNTIDKMKQKGVNKVIVLSHTGTPFEKEMAQKLSGVDVIIGGHTHELKRGIVPGENLLYSKDGEPVIITQAGKDGKYFGVLNLEFDENGKIIKAQNNIGETGKYPRNLVMKTINDSIIGSSELVGEIASAETSPDTAYAENPYANFLADAMRSEMGTDLAFIQGGHMRGSIPAGKITARDIMSVTPFRNRMVKYELTEDALVEALRWGAESNFKPEVEFKPSLLQVSGLRYTVTKDGKLVSANFVDKNGKEHPIDINNPNPSKKYSVALDDYCATNLDYPTLRLPRDKWLNYYEFDKDKIAIDFVKKRNGKPFDIKCDGRIKIV